MTAPRFITRKELAQYLDVSIETVRRNEARWRLREARADLNRRLVRYWRVKAMKRVWAITGPE